MEHSGQQMMYVYNLAGQGPPSLCSCASNRNKNTNPSPPTRETQQTPYLLPAASPSSTTRDSALSHSTLYTSTEAPPTGSKAGQSAYQFQTSLSPLLAQARAGASTSSSGSSKTKFLNAIFDRKRRDGKQASKVSHNTPESSSQACSSGSQTVHSAPGPSSPKGNESTQQQQPQVSFADLVYRYGGPSFKTPRS